MNLLPHTTQPITTEPASYEMRGWMERVKILGSGSIGSGETTHTTNGDVFLTCLNSAPVIVTLNLSPVDGEDAIIWRAEALVKISATFLTGSSFSIFLKGDTAHCKFSLAANAWAIV